MSTESTLPTEAAGTTEDIPTPKSREEVAWYLSLGLGRMPDDQELDEAMGITAQVSNAAADTTADTSEAAGTTVDTPVSAENVEQRAYDPF